MEPFLLILLSLASPGMAESLFRQPEVTDTKAAAAIVIGEVHPQSERFYVRLGNYGKTTPLVLPTWDAGRFTGLHVPAGFQHGLSPAPNATAVQVHGSEVGIWIDSDHPRPALGSLLPITPAYWWWDLSRAPMPFNRGLCAAGKSWAAWFGVGGVRVEVPGR